jgi:uncharacterized protein YceK
MLNLRETDTEPIYFASVVPPRSVYGGVRLDAKLAGEGIAYPFSGAKESWETWVENAGLLLLTVADLPFSAVADTVTLPVTVAAAAHAPRESRGLVTEGTQDASAGSTPVQPSSPSR